MKITPAILTLIFTITSYAHLEHRAGQESKPSNERLSVARGCFEEIRRQGCSHPRDGQEIFNTCLDDKKEMLSDSCQAFFTRLYGNRKGS